MDLITDRTLENVAARDALGTYNTGDLNRVESAAEELSGQMQGLEAELRDYAGAQGVAWQDAFLPEYEAREAAVSVRKDWTMEDMPTARQMRRYLGNIQKLSGLLEVPLDGFPETMENLSFQGANAIEAALLACEARFRQVRADKINMIDQAAEAQKEDSDG